MKKNMFGPDELEPDAVGCVSLREMIAASMAISLKRAADTAAATAAQPPPSLPPPPPQIVVDLRDWAGLDLTDSHDNASIVQAALNQAATSGLQLYVPPGLIALDSTITWPNGAQVVGAGQASSVVTPQYSWVHLTHSAVGFLAQGQPGARSMRGVNFYRTQPAPASGWTPLQAEADIEILGAIDVTITDCTFLNPTRMISGLGDVGAPAGMGRLILRNIKGQPLQSGIVLTQAYDVCWMDEIHFWPFWSQDPNVMSYIRGNAYAITLNRVDNPKFGRIFTFGYWRGLAIGQQASVGNDAALPPGTASLLHIDILGVDGCQMGLLVTAGTTGPTMHINQMYVNGNGADPAIFIASNNGQFTIGSLYAASTNGLIQLSGSGNTLTIGTSRSQGIVGTEFFVVAGNTLRLIAPPQTSAPTVYAGPITGASWQSLT